MQTLKIKKGDYVAHRQDKVMEWYLIQSGSVVRHYNYAELKMGPNAIIGILENEWFSCDYTADEDTSLIVIPCKNDADLRALLKAQPNFRPIFLRTALEQRHQAFALYADLRARAAMLSDTAQNGYSDYCALCSRLMMPEQSFYRLSHFEPLKIQHKVENWELASSQSLMRDYQREYLQLMIKNDDLCVGSIMQAAAQMHRTAQGIEEIADYMMCSRDVIWNDDEDDIFHLYYGLAVRLAAEGKDAGACREHMEEIAQVMNKLGIYDQMQLEECARACANYQTASTSEARTNIAGEDCVAHIMTFAGYSKEDIRAFKLLLQSYKHLPDRAGSDKESRSLRKAISQKFYEIYGRAFVNSIAQGERVSTIMQMFFNFGFMDAELLGADKTNELSRFSESLGLFNYANICTFYEWLKKVYRGDREPSRNEFDLDYSGYLQEQLKQGEITQKEFSALRGSRQGMMEFEISNMFMSTHKAISGRLTSFCPVLSGDDLTSSFDKMAVTASRVEQALNYIRGIDYSAFYREVLFSDADHGITQEWIMKEILPDVILLPGVGSRSSMWQEAAARRTDTPARFIFPIFINSDLDEQMLVSVGRYRWEMCRRVQGAYWNDYRYKSLTAEYFSYLQFYRKNKDLSADAREKLKAALLHARNNFREVFVPDYAAWVKYESQGSFRLNKVTRDILTRYCPFSKDIRASLSSNPLYQNAFGKLEIENKKKAARLQALYKKYEAAGGKITEDLAENLKFCQM